MALPFGGDFVVRTTFGNHINRNEMYFLSTERIICLIKIHARFVVLFFKTNFVWKHLCEGRCLAISCKQFLVIEDVQRFIAVVDLILATEFLYTRALEE